MPKSKRSVPARQRNKDYIAAAKNLKAKGLLGPKTNLHSGKYISKYAAQQVERFREVANANYTTVKVSKKQAEEAKSRGFITKSNFLVIPKEKAKEVKRAVKEKTFASAIGVRPLPGGTIDVVQLPHDIMDMRKLVEALGEGGLNDLKQPDELFTFRYRGSGQHGLAYRVFRNTQQLLQYLFHYNSIFNADGSINTEFEDENFDGFELLRIREQDVGLIRPKSERKRSRIPRAKDRKEAMRMLRTDWHPDRLKRFRKRNADRERARRENMTDEAKAEYRAKGLARALASKARKREAKK